MPARCTGLLREGPRLANELEAGATRLPPPHDDLVPPHAGCPVERLGERFFHGEAPGQGARRVTPRQIRALHLAADPSEEPVTVALEDSLHPLDGAYVQPDADNHAASVARRAAGSAYKSPAIDGDPHRKNGPAE